jgi:phosphohistidine phosphatase
MDMESHSVLRDRILVLMRHAQAGDAQQFFRETGLDDRERPLTDLGKRNQNAAMRGLTVLLPSLDHLWSSPYRRAWQTATIVHAAYGVPLQTSEVLAPPWSVRSLVSWLQARLTSGQTGLLVGHEPDLSALLAHWLGLPGGNTLVIPTGMACALRMEREFAPGAQEMLWMVPQSLLMCCAVEQPRTAVASG